MTRPRRIRRPPRPEALALTRLLALALAAVGLVLAGCTDAQGEPKAASPSTRLIDESQFGGAWPFTVESGRIACQRRQGLAVVTFEVDGTLYALNAAARIRGYAQLRRIWALAPRTGWMKDVSLVAEFGRELCQDG